MQTPPLTAALRRNFRVRLLRWYDKNRRELPWRANRDPYRVWISEIMLQQTRVTAVLDRYRDFLRRFPDVRALARAQSNSVLAAWSGLGYYRRARLMHAAARRIVGERGGRFPEDAAGWRELPGIGRYTAAAIASICYDEPCAVVDGNVERVLQRVLPAQAGNRWEQAAELLSKRRPGDFNQAFMELGALVCTPRAAKCTECPLRRICGTARAGVAPSSSRGARRQRAYVACSLTVAQGKVLLVQRAADETVMPGMWELPEVPLPSPEISASEMFSLKHAIMNTDYVVLVVLQNPDRPLPERTRDGAGWFSAARAAKLPLTGLARKALIRAGVFRSQGK